MDSYYIKRFKGVNGDYFGDFYINGVMAHSVMARTKIECEKKIDEFAYEIECGTWKNYVNSVRLKYWEKQIAEK